MAASRGLYQPRVILSDWNSGGNTVGFFGAFEGKGTLDRFSSRISGAKCSAYSYNKSYRLEKRGSI